MSINVRVKSKIDSLANWTANNPVLLSGELGVVKDEDNFLIKVGNGASRFNDLNYLNSKSLSTESIYLNGEDLATKIPKLTISDEEGISAVNQLSVIKISPEDYAQILQSEEGASRNALYIISSDTMTAANQRITDVADAQLSSDAVNFGQLTNMLSDLSIDGTEDLVALRTMLSTVISRFGGNIS